MNISRWGAANAVRERSPESHRIPESQHGQGWKGPLWVTQSKLLPKQGHLQQAVEELVQAGLEYLQRRRLHSLPGQPGPGLRHPQKEEVLPPVQLELPLLLFVPVAPCPVTGHPWKESGPVLLTPTLQIFRGISKVPSQPSLLQAEQAQFPQPLLVGEMLQPLLIILVALRWTLSSNCSQLWSDSSKAEMELCRDFFVVQGISQDYLTSIPVARAQHPRTE